MLQKASLTITTELAKLMLAVRALDRAPGRGVRRYQKGGEVTFLFGLSDQKTF